METLKPLYHVELEVKGRAHFYNVIDGAGHVTQYPGVTGFLNVINKPALITWAKNEALTSVQNALINRIFTEENRQVILTNEWIYDLIEEAKAKPEKIRDDAADLGTQAHAFIDLIINGKEPEEVPEQIAKPVKAFRDWWNGSGIELVMGDTKVASTLYGYGGSLDALGKRNGEYIILDWKTGSGIYVEAALQVAAYSQAFMETYGMPCNEATVVRFSKKEPITFEVKNVLDVRESFQTFLLAKDLSQALKIAQWQ